MIRLNTLEKKSRLIWIVLGVHVIMSTLMLLFYGTGHPLLRFMKSWDVVYQLLLTNLFGFIIYGLAGYFLLLAFGDRYEAYKSMKKPLLILSTVLAVVFVGTFLYSYFLYSDSGWLIYSLFNPIFGNMVLETATRSIWMLLWLPSAFLPSLGLFLGMFLHIRIWQGENE